MTDAAPHRVARGLSLVGDFAIFCGRAALDLVRPPYEGRETFRQVVELGWRSVPLIGTSGLAVGIVLSLHTRATLERFGAEALVAPGLGVALVRETGPLIAALLLAGRMGAGIAAEVAAMKVTEQVDALEATAVDSFRFLVATRVLAAVIALPLLTTLMNFGGIVGGWLAELALTGTPLTTYLERAFSLVDFTLYISSVLKTAVFGFLIAATGAFQGLTTTGGTEGVGRAATRSVVMASVLVIAVNVVLVRLIFVLFPELQ
ncbi:MAG: ABC transporter permease [Vicinamibacteraceae bacterium]|nr:ABC transporter permease [Vicinamibacteraceae bacterium]